MRNRLEVTAPRRRDIKVHIIRPGTGMPHCGNNMISETKIVTYEELMGMGDRVCETCLSKELNGGF